MSQLHIDKADIGRWKLICLQLVRLQQDIAKATK